MNFVIDRVRFAGKKGSCRHLNSGHPSQMPAVQAPFLQDGDYFTVQIKQLALFVRAF
jgi:hypothetical protein